MVIIKKWLLTQLL